MMKVKTDTKKNVEELQIRSCSATARSVVGLSIRPDQFLPPFKRFKKK